MKTSLVVKDYNERLVRAATPDDGEPVGHTAHYHAACVARGLRTLPSGRLQRKWKEQENVLVRNNVFHADGGKLDRIRLLPLTHIEALAVLDARRDRLHQEIVAINGQEQDILARAYEQADPLTMKDARAWVKPTAQKAVS